MLTEIENETPPENAPAETDAPPAGLPAAVLMGVGGGGNAIAAEVRADAFPLERVFVDASGADLSKIAVAGAKKILIGAKALRGFGAGTNPERGAAAARESEAEIRALFEKTDLLFLVVALGHGTGSGAAPAIVEIAREMGVVVVCFATRPYSDEGALFTGQADAAVEKLRARCNAFVLAENDALDAAESREPSGAFHRPAAAWIARGVRVFAETLFAGNPDARLDFATFRSIFPVVGARTLFAVGEGSGAETAAENALGELLRCPLSKTTVAAARSDTLLLRIEAGPPPAASVVDDVAGRVQARFGGEERMFTKIAVVPERGDSIEICVIGAGEIRAARRKRDSFVPAPKKTAAPEDDAPVSAPEETEDAMLFDPDRGVFQAMRKRLYEGIDLDAPTFRRKRVNLQNEIDVRRKRLRKT